MAEGEMNTELIGLLTNLATQITVRMDKMETMHNKLLTQMQRMELTVPKQPCSYYNKLADTLADHIREHDEWKALKRSVLVKVAATLAGAAAVSIAGAVIYALANGYGSN